MPLRREESKEREEKSHRDIKIREENRIQVYYKRIKITNHYFF